MGKVKERKKKDNGCRINIEESFCFVSPSIPKAFS
jgi:hypothetical protein